MTPADVLRAAASRVRRGWTQGANARDIDGVAVEAYSESAVCWCAVGAICAAADGSPSLAVEAVAAMDGALRGGCAAFWNDRPSRTAEQVATQMEYTAARLDGAT